MSLERLHELDQLVKTNNQEAGILVTVPDEFLQSVITNNNMVKPCLMSVKGIFILFLKDKISFCILV